MKSRPILFSPAMVSAILAGTKTQTRRTVNPQFRILHSAFCDGSISTNRIFEKGDGRIHCPYGKPGDQLWIREEHYRFGHWQPIDGILTKGGRQKWQLVPADGYVRFPDETDAPKDFRKGRHHQDPATPAWHKRLARFMPREFSRITLTIDAIRVQRLQEISAADCLAEGVFIPTYEGKAVHRITGPFQPSTYWPVKTWNEMKSLPDLEDHLLRAEYASLWETINGPGSWAQNPWVWVVCFKVLPP
jgi:hypothetical protein